MCDSCPGSEVVRIDERSLCGNCYLEYMRILYPAPRKRRDRDAELTAHGRKRVYRGRVNTHPKREAA